VISVFLLALPMLGMAESFYEEHLEQKNLATNTKANHNALAVGNNNLTVKASPMITLAEYDQDIIADFYERPWFRELIVFIFILVIKNAMLTMAYSFIIMHYLVSTGYISVVIIVYVLLIDVLFFIFYAALGLGVYDKLFFPQSGALTSLSASPSRPRTRIFSLIVHCLMSRWCRYIIMFSLVMLSLVFPLLTLLYFTDATGEWAVMDALFSETLYYPEIQ